MLGFIWCILRSDAELEHASVVRGKGIHPRVFQDASFKRDMQKIAVHGVGFFGRSLDRDSFLVAIRDHLGTSWELVAKPCIAPGSDDLELWGQCRRGEFESDLVVALPCGAMRERFGAFFACDL